MIIASCLYKNFMALSLKNIIKGKQEMSGVGIRKYWFRNISNVNVYMNKIVNPNIIVLFILISHIKVFK